jgi:hypothetical protein
MSFRDSWLPNIVLGVVFYLLPNKKELARLLFRRPTRHDTTITPPTGKLEIDAPTEPLPICIPSAIVMANQPPRRRTPSRLSALGPGMTGPSRFMNNSMAMQWEAARSQHNTATRFGALSDTSSDQTGPVTRAIRGDYGYDFTPLSGLSWAPLPRPTPWRTAA